MLQRKIFQLEQEQAEFLRELAYKTRESESAHVRRALELYLYSIKLEKEDK
jgi:predicted transcriptional regulator